MGLIFDKFKAKGFFHIASTQDPSNTDDEVDYTHEVVFDVDADASSFNKTIELSSNS